MRTNRLFWGVVLVILGGLLMLQSLGIVNWNIWLVFWPSLLILAGAWILLGPTVSKRNATSESVSIPLEAAQEAVIEINHGAGKLKIGAGASPANLVEGTFVGGVEHRVEYTSTWASLRLATPSNLIFGMPGVMGSEGLRWDLQLNDTIPLEVRLHTGAGESRIDFSALNVRKVSLETGASSTTITLPAKAGFTSVDVHAGAAAVVLRVPQGVAGRIQMKSGLVGTKIDNNRFPFNGNIYETPEYDSAENRVEILVEAGVGSIEIMSA